MPWNDPLNEDEYGNPPRKKKEETVEPTPAEIYGLKTGSGIREDSVPAGPFQRWLTRRMTEFDSDKEFAGRVGMSARNLKRLRYTNTTVQLETVDKILSADGHTHLIELYPELYA